MQRFFSVIIVFHCCLLFPQSKINYYKVTATDFGSSAISNSKLTAKTFSFSYPVYKFLADTVTNQIVLSVRQKDPTGRLYTKMGYHLAVNPGDSVMGVSEDTKYDLDLIGDFLLLSNENKTSRFNLLLGYEQFEYPSRIIYSIQKNNMGLTYNPAIKTGTETALSCVNLRDGSLAWSAPVTAKSNWNGIKKLNDSVIIIAAGGIHALDLRRGLTWSYPLITSERVVKPITYSSFISPSFLKASDAIITNVDDPNVTQICSNILVTKSSVFFAGKNKIVALANDGKLLWESDISVLPVSNCILFESGENILMINLGIARFAESCVLYGKPFVSAFNKQSGKLILEKNEEMFNNLVDINAMNDKIILANKNQIIQISDNLNFQKLIELDESRYGKFLEFIDGNDYYVEKEGYYVPLNFINDKVVYFKTDHGKVFGLNNSEIEYEYHYTELYKFNNAIGKKKLISQKSKTLLISENFELLYTLNSGEQATVLKNKLYFSEGRLLHVVNMNDLK